MVNRIFTFIENQQLTPTEFADKIGVSRASISSIKTGRTQPTLSLVEKIKQHFPEIDINWLIFGKGEMIIKLEAVSESKLDDNSLFEEFNKIKEDNPLSTANDYEAIYIAESPKTTIEEKVNPISQTNDEVKNDKILKKVILLYSDGSFEEFIK